MALVRPSRESLQLIDPDATASYLADLGIEYERWSPSHAVAPGAAPEEILSAYATEIDRWKTRGGYVTADVIDVTPATPGLDEMLAKFSREHWHDEDEVRFIIGGSGLFHIRPALAPVLSLQVEPGDLVRVPRGTRHWFDLCPDRVIRAIRLFKDPAGWVPRYTGSGIDREFDPV